MVYRSALICFNERALEDSEFAINFAMLFTSHHFDGLQEHLQSPDGNSAFREHILNMLQRNHSSMYTHTAAQLMHSGHVCAFAPMLISMLFSLFSPISDSFATRTDAEKLKAHNVMHFYNSITLLGEFYHRLHKKAQPVGVVGRSLFDLLAKEVRNETTNCTNDPSIAFDVQFARLLLTQVRVYCWPLLMKNKKQKLTKSVCTRLFACR